MADLTAEDLRCPACGATVRPGAPWCSQCYAGRQPGQHPLAPPPAPPPAPRPPRVAVQLLPGAPPSPPAACWPCSTCGAVNPLADACCASCGAGFLAGLRAEEPPLLELPGVGDVAALSRLQRLALGAAVMAAVVVLTLLLSLLTS